MFGSVLGALRNPISRSIILPALVGLAIVVLGGLYIEKQSHLFQIEKTRTDLLDKISLIRARLEGHIEADVQLVRGLVATIAEEPDLTQERFSRLAARVLPENSQVKNIAVAPDLKVSMVYPFEQNKSVVGLDYTKNPAQRAEALRARDTGRFQLAGPLNLVQGGSGLVGRYPVFHTNADGSREFWGLVAVVIDVDKLFLDAGLLPDMPFKIAITGRDASGPRGDLFYGSPDVLGEDPVTTIVDLPTGSWQIAAAPEGGWPHSAPNVWLIRLFTVLAIIFVVGPIVVSTGLMGERLRNRLELIRVSRRLRLALKASRVGVWEYDMTRDKLYWDQRMRQLYGASEVEEVTYRTWEQALHADDLSTARREFDEAMQGKRSYASQFRVVLPSGKERHIRAMGSLEHDPDGSLRILGINWDVSEDVLRADEYRHAKTLAEARTAELEVANRRIEQIALHDPLTGLPNRRYLDKLFAGDMGKMATQGFGLLHIDLDRFKHINDTLGHAAGDAMLVHASKVLRENAGPGDVVTRIGGDEFLMVCRSNPDRMALEALAARIVKQMHEPYVFEGQACRTGASVGIAMPDAAGGDPRKLLVNADIALYRAKKQGRNGYQFFSQELHRTVVANKALADEILDGLERDEFEAFYQGQFNAHSLEIEGVEALVRWHHPGRGLLAAGAFLEVAEELNVLADLDQIILTQSLEQMRKWKAAGIEVPKVSVNVSTRRLADPNLIESLEALSFEPGTLTFELLESTFLDQRDDQVNWNLEQLSDLGIDIEIDDFGTGYASIVSLMRLRPTRLKIDRQLTMPVLNSENQRQLLRSIVDIGTSLGIDAVAEGVETMEQARILRELGCTSLQGYALAKPMSGDNFTQFAMQHRKSLKTNSGQIVA